MFSSMLYRAFKGGDKMFHLFTDHSLQDPADYEKLAVEIIKFAGELKQAIQQQEDAKAAEAAPAQPAPADPAPVVADQAPAQP